MSVDTKNIVDTVRKFIRAGRNDKWFIVRKDAYTLTEADCVTADGYIKQSVLKAYLLLSSMVKAKETLHDILVGLVWEKKLSSNGELQATVTEDKNARRVLDTDMLTVALSKHGYTLEQFYKDGKKAKKLFIR